jgi:acyl-CoA thioesterase-1
MKNKILVLFLISSFVFLSCAKEEIRNINSTGKNIICFGNSITAGYGLNKEEAYPYLLEKMLNFPVINAGLDGDTTAEALKRLSSDVLEKEPYLVIIELGGNDFLNRVPLGVTLNNMEKIIQQIQDKGAMVALCDISIGPIMADYHQGYKNLSKKYKTIFIPHLLSGILTQPELKTDYIHPNAQGQKLIFQRIYQAIRNYLK